MFPFKEFTSLGVAGWVALLALLALIPGCGGSSPNARSNESSSAPSGEPKAGESSLPPASGENPPAVSPDDSDNGMPGSKDNPTSGTPCGPNVCGEGEECCNASCGICVPTGGMCTQQFCE